MSSLAEKIQRGWRSAHYALSIDNQLYRNLPQKDVIVMYHQVLPGYRTDVHLRNISTEDFKKHLRYFKSRFQVTSLEKIFEAKRPAGRLAITFDDGIINNLRYALPVLENEKVPATFFTTTPWIRGENVLWPDVLSILLSQAGNSFEFRRENYIRTSLHHFRNERTKRTIQEVLLDTPAAEINQFLESLSKKLSLYPSRTDQWEDMCRVMKGEEIKILSQSTYAEIGSHGILHHNMLGMSPQQVKEEFADSRDYLENVTGKKISSFAFPFGLYSREILDMASEAGYKHLLAVNYRFKEDHGDHRILHRIGLYPDRSWAEQMHQVHTF